MFILMAVIKQACPKCGQRVSGDESFYGTSVECPICSSDIFFPDPNPPKEEPETKEEPGDDADALPKPPPMLDESIDLPLENDLDFLAPSTPRPPATTQPTYSEPPSATLSIISMVLGILNVVTFCLPALLLAPAAIICGHIALIKGQFSPIQPPPGRIMAIVGLVLGYLGMAVTLVVLVLAATGLFNAFEWLKGIVTGAEG